ncbi:sensor histidine kinase [Sphingobacterium spiritivorum]
MKSVLLFWICILCGWSGLAQGRGPILIDNAERFNISNHGFFYEDRALTATIDSLIRLKNQNRLNPLTPGKTFNKGFSESYWWIVFDVHNILNETVHLFFNERSNSINRLQLFKVDSAGRINATGMTGDHFKFGSRPVEYHNYLFPVKLKAHEKATFFLWADKRGQNMMMPLGLAKDINLMREEIPFYTSFGIFVGIYLFAIVFSLFLYISLRDSIHIYYAFYVICVLIFNLEDEGLGFQWIYRDLPYLQDYLRSFIAYASSALLVHIMLLFIHQTRDNSRLYPVLNGYKWFCILLMLLPAYLFFDSSLWMEKLNFYTANIVALLTVLILIVNTIERIISGYRLAWYYLASMLILLLGILNYVFNILGITSFYLFNTTGLVIGLTVEIVFLSFALTQRYNFLKKETRILQQEKAKLEIALVDDVFAVQEKERIRLARDLHDDLGGTLSAIKLNVTAFKANIVKSPDEIHAFYQQTIRMIETACESLREISHNLMPKPLDEKGLTHTLSEQLTELNQSGHITFEFVHEIGRSILPETELTLYRIMKELINNVVRHSAATKASLQIISTDEHIIVMCEDNGTGFDTGSTPAGIGLSNIRLRINHLNGTLNLESNERGTSISIFIPHYE